MALYSKSRGDSWKSGLLYLPMMVCPGDVRGDGRRAGGTDPGARRRTAGNRFPGLSAGNLAAARSFAGAGGRLRGSVRISPDAGRGPRRAGPAGGDPGDPGHRVLSRRLGVPRARRSRPPAPRRPPPALARLGRRRRHRRGGVHAGHAAGGSVGPAGRRRLRGDRVGHRPAVPGDRPGRRVRHRVRRRSASRPAGALSAHGRIKGPGGGRDPRTRAVRRARPDGPAPRPPGGHRRGLRRRSLPQRPPLFRSAAAGEGRGAAGRRPRALGRADARGSRDPPSRRRGGLPAASRGERRRRHLRPEGRLKLARFRDWPLRWKLLGLLAAASAVPIAVTTVLGFRASSAQIRRSATVVLGARADQLANEVDAFNAAFLFAAERLATLPEAVDFCGLSKERRLRREGRMSATLSTFGGADPRTHVVALLDAGGTVTASTNPAIRGRNYALRRYVQTAVAGRAAISDVFISVVGAGGAPSIAYASPVRGGSGVVAGVALVVARGESLWDLLAEHNGSAGPGSYSVLFDAYGIRIAHSYKRDDVFHPSAPLDAATISAFVADRRFGDDTRRLLEGVVPMPEEFSRVKSGNGGGEFMAYAPTNQAVNLGVGRRLKTVPWTVFYLVPKQSLDAPVRQVVDQSLAANGAILGFALAAGLLLARSILIPVQGLTQAARAIREGDLSPNVSVRSQDELGELASAFEAMAASLRAGREQLEEKVRVRTEALESAMDSLEAQNQALAQRTAELTNRQQRDVAYGRAVTALAGEGSLPPVLEAALRDAATFAGAAVIACYRVSGQKLTPIAQVGLAPEGNPTSLAVGGAAAEAFRSRRPVVLDPLPEGVELRFDAVLAA